MDYLLQQVSHRNQKISLHDQELGLHAKKMPDPGKEVISRQENKAWKTPAGRVARQNTQALAVPSCFLCGRGEFDEE